MLQLRILSGKTAGTEWVARRFPVRIGRAINSDLRLEEDGIWENHLVIHLDRTSGLILETAPQALTSLNGERISNAILQNGDLIEVGSVKMQFFLAKTKQNGLGFREALTWITIALISLGQVVLVYLLLK